MPKKRHKPEEIGKHGEWLADDHLFYTDDIDPHRWEKPYIE